MARLLPYGPFTLADGIFFPEIHREVVRTFTPDHVACVSIQRLHQSWTRAASDASDHEHLGEHLLHKLLPRKLRMTV